MAHLRPEARDLALLPATERLARMPANRWIGYTRANQALTLLGRMLAKEPGRIRPRNLLIVGPTNNGKTAIAERFHRDPSNARQRTASMRSFRCCWCKCHLRQR
jgi:Bacterial TniB protein